jgi:hypothetical protein
VGLWPSQQNVISKITKIEIWYNTDRINGIQVTYLKTDSTTQTMLHGSAVDDEGLIELTGESSALSTHPPDADSYQTQTTKSLLADLVL